MRPEDVPEEWIALASEAHRTAPQKRDGKPTRMRHALAAVIPAIRAAAFAEVRADLTTRRDRAHDAEPVTSQDLDRMIRAERSYDLAIEAIDRAARGDA